MVKVIFKKTKNFPNSRNQKVNSKSTMGGV